MNNFAEDSLENDLSGRIFWEVEKVISAIELRLILAFVIAYNAVMCSFDELKVSTLHFTQLFYDMITEFD